MNEQKHGVLTGEHKFVLASRKKMSVEGVKEVVSFDETSVALITSCGELVIDGESLHVSILDVERGFVELDGRINGITYYDGNESNDKKSFWSRFGK